MGELVYVVENHIDLIKPRKRKLVEKEKRQVVKFMGHAISTCRNELVFDAEDDACAFLVQRAKDRVKRAEKGLAKERARLRKCEAKAARKTCDPFTHRWEQITSPFGGHECSRCGAITQSAELRSGIRPVAPSETGKAQQSPADAVES